MKDDLSDEIDAVELGPGDRVSKYKALEALAADAEPGSSDWAELLLAASDQRLYAGEPDIAIAHLEAVRESGVTTDPSVEAHLLSAHLELGNEEAARALDRELRMRSQEIHLGADYVMIGEAYEIAGEMKQALRWYSLANRDIDPVDIDELDRVALWGRQRVRGLLELPEDAYDIAASELREIMRLEPL